MNAITKNKIEDGLAHLHFYSGLKLDAIPAKERHDLEAQSKIMRVPKKAILYTEGEVPKGIYIVLKGKIKLTQLNLDGSVQVLFICSAGDVFGHRPILSNDKHFVSAGALEDSEILFIDRDHFLNVMKSSETLSGLLLQSAFQEFSVLASRINIFAQKSIKERLAYFLLLLNEKYKLPGQVSDEAEIKVNRGDLASYTGTSLENLVRTIKDFKDKNYIRTEGKSIFINDFESLYSLTGI